MKRLLFYLMAFALHGMFLFGLRPAASVNAKCNKEYLEVSLALAPTAPAPQLDRAPIAAPVPEIAPPPEVAPPPRVAPPAPEPPKEEPPPEIKPESAPVP